MGNSLVEYKEKLRKKAAAAASVERGESSFISLKGGMLTIGEETLPGNEMLCVVLDSIHENTFYAGDYDPDVQLPPTCFAFGRSDKEMEPHDNVPHFDDDDADKSHFQMQAEWCDQCPNFEWGSAEKGRGKACSVRRRLILIPAGNFIPSGKRGVEPEMEVFDEAEAFDGSNSVMLKLPVTSVKAWSRYVNELNTDHQMPPFAAITRLFLMADAKSQYKVEFELVEIIEDEAILEVLFRRNAEAMETIEDPYTEPEEDEAPATKARSGVKNLRKKRGDD